MRVVDHHPLDHTACIAQRIGEKHFAVETLKSGIDLEKQHARIAQHRRSRLRFVLPAAHFHRVRRRIVLHFHARLEVILARRHERRLPDTLPAAEPRQRRIR